MPIRADRLEGECVPPRNNTIQPRCGTFVAPLCRGLAVHSFFHMHERSQIMGSRRRYGAVPDAAFHNVVLPAPGLSTASRHREEYLRRASREPTAAIRPFY